MRMTALATGFWSLLILRVLFGMAEGPICSSANKAINGWFPKKQAATAMGYKRTRRLLEVELPLAAPVILAGVRVAAVSNISLVSVGALLGIGGLGALFTRGFQLFYTAPIVVGIVLSILLAAIADVVIVLFQRAVTPWTRAGAGA